MANMELTAVDTLIRKQMAAKGLKRDVDVQELYLCESDITEVESLARFRNLRNLWLNGNKLRRIRCLRDNFRLSELHLQNNQLVDITGALSHLTSLHVLMLHNNQLTNLQHVLREFNKMSNLKTLNLLDNPVAQEPDYRIFVVKSVPSVELLDRQEVSAAEKKKARVIYREDREAVSRRIAFGRRAQSPARSADHCKPLPRKLLLIDTAHLGNSFVRDNPPYGNEDDAIQARRKRGLISMFTHFDWSQVPRIQERRMSDKPFDSPQLITHVYR